MRVKGATKSNVGEPVNPEQGMLESNQRIQESKSCALPLGECPMFTAT